MRIPQFNRQVSDNSVPNVQVSGGMSAGEAASLVGNKTDSLVGALNSSLNAYQAYQDEADKARVSQVIAEVQNSVNDYLYNPKTGLLNIKGEAALKRSLGNL
ncbi:hypothetical protein PX666_05460 [Acinetobacter baumannii]|nr:hypothetical protein PX666_05460 [Acinetobacter baumannii]